MDFNRYSRNILVENFGIEGQQKLFKARVLVIGAGGLGSPVLYYLAAAGIGTLGIIDYDAVDVSNLQRQIIHRTDDIGVSKVVSASEKIRALNPEIVVNTYCDRLTDDNAADYVGAYDFVVDCCDSFTAKFLIDDICVYASKPYSHGAVVAMCGEVMTYTPGNASYRHVFGEPPAEDAASAPQEGVIGAVAGIVGSIQAAEAIKYFTGIGELLTNRILFIDGKTMQFRSLSVPKPDSGGI